jgi:hypothetical protein
MEKINTFKCKQKYLQGKKREFNKIKKSLLNKFLPNVTDTIYREKIFPKATLYLENQISIKLKTLELEIQKYNIEIQKLELNIEELEKHIPTNNENLIGASEFIKLKKIYFKEENQNV